MIWWNGSEIRAHRVAYELAFGPIPDGLMIRHAVCGNPVCCRPDHLAAGTVAENSADTVRMGRANLARLTPDQVVGLRWEYHLMGMNQSELARQHGLDAATVNQALTGRHWQSVGGPIAPIQIHRHSVAKRAP